MTGGSGWGSTAVSVAVAWSAKTGGFNEMTGSATTPKRSHAEQTSDQQEAPKLADGGFKRLTAAAAAAAAPAAAEAWLASAFGVPAAVVGVPSAGAATATAVSGYG